MTRDEMRALAEKWLAESNIPHLVPYHVDSFLALLTEVAADARKEALEGAALLFEDPMQWLCLDNGLEESERIAERIRALAAKETT
jgi:hypothetical protein